MHLSTLYRGWRQARAVSLLCLGTALLASYGGTAQATERVAFTVNGTVTDPNPALGYGSGSALSFTWVLDPDAARQARFSGPNCSGCAGTLAWFQDFFSTTPQLWESITGSGLSGAWQPPADRDDGWVAIGVGDFPQPYPGYFGMLANAQIGFPTGLLANGRPVSALQMTATFLGLDAVGTLGGGTVFSDPPPDPTALFLGLVGTYQRDPLFSDNGAIWAQGPDGGQLLFRVDSLTISAVPEPGTTALWLAGGVGLLLLSLRRQRAAAQVGR